MLRGFSIVVQSSLAAALLCAPASGAPPVYTCPKVTSPPVIDGRTDDEAWRCAPPVTLVLSTSGRPAAKTTTARMCWDDTHLYIAFDCADTDTWGTYTRRDDPVYNEEVVEVFLSPDCDLTRYYEINVSPRNVVFDSAIINPDDRQPGEGTDNGWNCQGLRTAVCVDGTLDVRTDVDRGWSAELALPFSGLGRKTPRPGERWRVNLYRTDLSPEPAEFQAWSPTLVSPPRFHVPSRFGTVFFSEAP